MKIRLPAAKIKQSNRVSLTGDTLMVVESKKAFVKCLQASKIFDRKQLASVLEDHPADELKSFVSQLIKSNTLTAWQAKFLYTGRHQLRLGNYVLQDRIRQDELGDYFVASHTALNRPVEIQLLPKSLSDDTQLHDSFIGHAGLISELDHGNLSHIHDVDKSGGRFYMVSECRTGQPLSELELTANGLILCTLQILRALAFAHSHGVVHGDVCESNLTLDENQFKLCGMGLSFIRRKISGLADSTAREDMTCFANLLGKRFDVLSAPEQSEHAWLAKSIAELKSDPVANYPRILTGVESAVAEWGETQPNLIRSSESEVSTEPSNDGSLTEATHSASTADRAAPLPPYEYDEDERQPEELTGRSTGQGKLIMLTALGIFFAIMTTGGILYATGVFSNGSNPGEKPTNIDTRSVADQSSDRSESEKSTPPNEVNKKTTPKKISQEEIAAALAEAQGRTPSDIIAQQNASIKPTDQSAGEPSESNTPAVSIPTEQVTKTTATDVDQNAKPTPPNGNSPDPNTPKPLTGFASKIDFHTSEVKEHFEIGKLVANEKISSIDVISAPSCFSKGKGAFSTQQVSPTAWDLMLLGKAGQKKSGEVVGQFQIRDGAIQYIWGEKVGKRSKSNAIRNCILKITSGTDSKQIILRKPVSLSLKLTEKAYHQSVAAEAGWLPQKEHLKIEVAKPQAPWPRRLYIGDGQELTETHQFAENLPPFAIYFHPDAHLQYLSVVLQPVIKNDLKFNIAVFARGKDTDPVEFASYEDATAAINFLQRAKDAKLIQRDRAQAIADNAPYGSRGRTRDAANAVRREYDQIKDNLEISSDLREQLEQLHGAVLPVKVYYELEGHQVIIAQTSNNEN